VWEGFRVIAEDPTLRRQVAACATASAIGVLLAERISTAYGLGPEVKYCAVGAAGAVAGAVVALVGAGTLWMPRGATAVPGRATEDR
jgi:hypothetical protein